jgi:hypothetical protein
MMNAINGHSSSVACDHHHHRDNMMLPKPATTTTNNATAATATTATTATAVVAAATTTTGATTASVSTAPAISGQQAPPPRQPQPQEQQWMMPHLAPPPPLPQQQQRAPSPPPAAPSQHQQEHPEQQRPQELQHGQQQYSHEEQLQQQHHQRLHPPQQQQPYAEASASLAVASGMTFPTADAANDEDNSEYLNSTIHPIHHQQQQQQQHHTNNGERPPRRKRPKSMSFAYLQGQLLESSPLPNNTSNDLSSSRDDINVLSDATARGILKTLLDEHRVRLNEPPDDVVTALAYVQQRFYMPKQTVVKSMSIDQTLQLAKMDQLSFLGSFLMVLEEAEEAAAASATTSTTTASVAPALGSAGGAASVSVSALDLIKRCCLAIHPSKIPPLMDAEEMAIAALEFLGSNSTATSANGSSTLLPDLPLIRFVKYEADVRKRFYEKVGSWKLNDDKVTMQQVTALEDVFLSDCSDYRFLRRGVCGPRMTSTAAEDALYLRGKHKVPSNSSSNSTSNKRNSKQQQQSAAVRKAAATVAAANSTAVGGGDVANHDNHPIGEQQPSGFMTSPITLEDAGGETGELHNSRSHSPSYPEECYE